ncbi:MAG: hypothetical protein ACRC6T_03085 [Sarcina sp.]
MKLELDLEYINKLNNYPIKKLKKNFKFLGEGIARKVFSLNDKYVVKVAKNDDGYHQNFVERYIYGNCPSHIKKYLCPIYYSNDRIIIMAKATPYNKILGKHVFVNPCDFRPESSVVSDLNQLINNFYLYREDIYAARSWGVIDGEFFLIDFGCTSDFGDMFYDGIKSIYYMNKNSDSLAKNNQ